METYKKESLEKRLGKAGLKDGSISRDGRYQLRIKPNGRPDDAFWYPCIYDLVDPSDGMTDYFTTQFPNIKRTIEIMTRGGN